ncbi:MAG: sigma-70 family RNA polymerase sigma factor [Planctomycetes bacterium]|nr:sigma-70 family RNA polymerase sigma factor [Planctomycetota bacterium]
MTTSPTNEQELLRGIAAGRTEDFDTVVSHYQSALLRYARSFVGDAQTSEDVVQETFMALVRLRASITEIDSLPAWLFRVTRNRALDQVKKESRMRQREGAVAAREAIPPEPSSLEIDEQRTALARQLHDLDGRTRELLLLKIREGRSYREIATITGASVGQVSKLIHQGLARVARGLEAEGAPR